MPAVLGVGTYDPESIVITFGSVVMSGYAEGTFVNIERSGARFEKRMGADGSVDRINKRARDFTVTLTLMQSSPINDVLSSLSDIDAETNTGKKPMTVKDLSGTTLFFAPESWIETDPSIEFGDSLGNREWIFATGISKKHTGSAVV
jgi:hypothetical protein